MSTVFEDLDKIMPIPVSIKLCLYFDTRALDVVIHLAYKYVISN